MVVILETSADPGPRGLPGLLWREEGWDANRSFAVNDAVTYNGASYRCRVAILPNSAASSPPNDGARWALFAAKGAQGDVGPQGEIGDTGPDGSEGPQGIQGSDGPQGIQGVKGDTGDTGEQGIQGIQGVQGIQGNVGPQGSAGQSFTWRGGFDVGANYVLDDAVRGSDGSTYVAKQGSVGEDPVVDVDPDTGEGTYWSLSTIHGAQGPQGTQGVQGDQGVDGPQGPQGIQGIQGPQGNQGNAGADGKTILNTVGAPANGTGANGDYALDVTTDPADPVLYGPKAGGAWPAGIHLKGPQGIQGIQGPAGADLSGVYRRKMNKGFVGGSIFTDNTDRALGENGVWVAATGGVGQGSTITLLTLLAAEEAVAGKTTKVRLMIDLLTADVAPGTTITFSLKPLTGVSGAATISRTFGAAIASVSFVAPAADSHPAPATDEVTLPGDGTYALIATSSAAFAANGYITGTASVGIRNV